MAAYTSQAGFQERIARIETGHQWIAENLAQVPASWQHEALSPARRKRQIVISRVLMMKLGALAVLAVLLLI